MNELVLEDALTRPLGDVLERFRTEGFAAMGPVLSRQGLEALRARADDVMLGLVPQSILDALFFQHDAPSGRYDDLVLGQGYVGPSLDYRKVEKLEHEPLFRDFIDNPVFRRVARALIEGDVVIYRAVLFTKGAGGGTFQPFHQDGGTFWGVDRAPFLQIWTALDDAPFDAGCVEFMPRTHLAGLATPLGGVVPANVFTERGVGEKDVVSMPARAGEAILIHNHVWHRSGHNTTGRTRRAMTVCYMTGATRCLRKKRAPRSFFHVFRDRDEAT